MNSTKSKNKQAVQRVPLKRIVGIAIVVVAVILGIWAVSNKNLYVADKKKVETEAKDVLATASSNDAPVYAHFEDVGCSTSDIGWLGTHIGCGFSGSRYLKTKDNAAGNLHAIDSRLRTLGFQLHQDNVLDGNASSQAAKLLSGEDSVLLTYDSPNSYVTTFLSYFKGQTDLTAKDYLHIPIDVALTPDEYVYGVSVKATYWSCSVTSWLELPCPSPPSNAGRQ